jgi:hypothetical protein
MMGTTRTKFTCELVTIRSNKPFAQVTQEIEALFQRYDLPELARLTADGDTDKLASFVARTGEHADRHRPADGFFQPVSRAAGV